MFINKGRFIVVPGSSIGAYSHSVALVVDVFERCEILLLSGAASDVLAALRTLASTNNS